MNVQLRLPTKPIEKGVVYTKPWVVDLILDFVGYRAAADLASFVAVEPAAGEGAFLVPMVRRLLESLRDHGRALADARGAVFAYEIDGETAYLARQLVAHEITAAGYSERDAKQIAQGWIVEADYLLSTAEVPSADVIVGNPPYIRYDDLGPGMFARYQAVCPTMRGRCDIYVGFIEKALRQLKLGGRLGFICADRWMRSAYGAELRKLVAAEGSVEAVIEMHDAPAFEDDVAAYPAVTVIQRAAQGAALVATAGRTSGPIEGGSLADAIVELAGHRRPTLPGFRATNLAGWYGGDVPWPWAEPETLGLIQDLESRFRPLEDAATGTKVGIGVATGADQVFVTTDKTRVEEDRLLPLAMAYDTRAGKVEWSGHYLVDPWGPDDRLVDLTDFPKLAAYFGERAKELKGRNVAGRHQEVGWHRTIDRVTHSLLQREKLYFPDMKLQANPVLDRGTTYPHHNLYFVVSDVWDLEVLGGLLLSKIAEMFVASYCVKMRGGTLRFQAQYLRRIRVPEPETIAEPVAERLRVAFRSRDREAATSAARDAYGISDVSSAA